MAYKVKPFPLCCGIDIVSDVDNFEEGHTKRDLEDPAYQKKMLAYYGTRWREMVQTHNPRAFFLTHVKTDDTDEIKRLNKEGFIVIEEGPKYLYMVHLHPKSIEHAEKVAAFEATRAATKEAKEMKRAASR